MLPSDVMSVDEVATTIQIDNQLLHKAIENAIGVSILAYAPYSHYAVGCSIISKNNAHLINSCNVENASFGLTICAERNGICKAISQGVTGPQMDVIVVYASGSWAMPCGACRQFLVEMNPNMWVVVVSPEKSNECRYAKAGDLLPHAFNL